MTTKEQPEEPGRETAPAPSFAAAVRGSALGGVATDSSPAAAVRTALGGVRGVVEAVVPGLLFLVVYTFTKNVPWALGVSVAAAVVFTLVRLARRSSPMQALVGLIGVVISAALALITGKGQDNFVPGMVINAVFFVAMVASGLVRRPLVGVVAATLTEHTATWRTDRVQYRSMQAVTAAWALMFALRLAIEVPLYAAGNIEGLAIARLLTGIPLYAPVFLLSWLIVRGVFRRGGPDADDRIVSTSR